jgi:outer membrane protein assembly factor BamB
MLKKSYLIPVVVVGLGLALSAQGPRRVALGDWPEMRGPSGDGTSRETGLPDTWAPNGENFLWRAPYGGRSEPIVMGNRLYVQNPAGEGVTRQERVMALDTETGAVLWEYRFNLFQSDVPPHRVGWAAPAADPETGNLYALSGGAQVVALSANGQPLWNRSLGEEWAAFTTHGGRTMSPLVDGDLVIVSAAISSWGEMANRAHRFVALDKRTGDIVYVTAPGSRPYDTAYAAPLITTMGGLRLLIAGLGNGGVHAVKPQTGEPVWSYVFSKRAINTGVAVAGNRVFVSQGDENLNTTDLGTIAAIDGTQTGEIAVPEWSVTGLEFGYSSPVTDGTRVYQIDNGATLRAFDGATGKALWTERLGNSQRAPAVLADGKLYAGTSGGSFLVIRPHADRAEILSNVVLPASQNSCCGSEGTPEQIVAGAAVSRGRIFFVSSDAIYAIGPRRPTAPTGFAVDQPAVRGEGAPAVVQVSPTELVLEPGESVQLRARLFDNRGRFLRDTPATWALGGLRGMIADGRLTVSGEQEAQAGVITATVGSLSGQARARVVHPLPYQEPFDGYADGAVPPGWINAATGRFSVTTLDGQKVFQKEATNTIFKRARLFFGPTDWSNYTFEADVRAPERRRQMADVGITAQRYSLVLYGTTQKLKLEPWEPETSRTETLPFAWKPDTWYHLKLRVENLPNGAVRARGKAWPTGEPEPAAWLIDRTDPIGNREGAPGLFVDADFGAYLDNFSLTPNQ